MKRDNGIFHHEQKYYRGRWALLSTFIFTIVFIPLVITQIKQLGDEDSINQYWVEMEKQLPKMEMISPQNEYLDGTREEKDNSGLFPMYIFNFNIGCD